jgi:dimeric dUTPase (all-alpha-NTP-PPase superfamily)
LLDKFKSMYTLQNTLNANTNGEKWAKTGITLQDREINWMRCIYMEAAEAIDSLNWKHWKDIAKADDIANVKIELVDIWHFIMSEHIVMLGIDDAILEAQKCFDEVKNQPNEYFEVMELIDLLEQILAQAANGDFPLTAFFRAIRSLEDFEMSDVYTLYIGKNCLNQFRQDHGYKDGSYIKIWDGKEDNVTMQTILEKNPNIDFDGLYDELKKSYEQFVN